MTHGIQSRSWSVMGLQVSGGVRTNPELLTSHYYCSAFKQPNCTTKGYGYVCVTAFL